MKHSIPYILFAFAVGLAVFAGIRTHSFPLPVVFVVTIFGYRLFLRKTPPSPDKG